MFVFMRPSQEDLQRIEPESGDQPMWFASPLYAAFGRPAFSNSAAAAIQASLAGESKFLVFTVSLQEVIAAPLLRFKNLVTLFQWPLRLDWKSGGKQVARDLVLDCSQTIVVLSKKSEVELSERFPKKEIRWIGHFVDTNFFAPTGEGCSTDTFLLCVGDHRRLEPMILDLAKRLRVRIIRVSKDKRVKRFYDEHPSPFVEVESDVSFLRLRFLYETCAVAINAADDRLWPVGITAFCEAMAMGRPIATSGFHSCSGYAEHLPNDSVRTVTELSSLQAWVEAVDSLLQAEANTRVASVKLAERFCSLRNMSATWRSVFENGQM